ncbi:helix-turn-helix domain-containing protein [Spirillospora sp. NPDC029432]|uniref:TetR/AcrR family transcriptional regulator n=1 Tax=Spirillospora sp. NPDC029432 TaxID=3154599 RepID=UPI003456167D
MARPRTTSDEAILEAAARALGRLGPGRLTLGVVAREAGLAPATLVQRFGSKRGLLLALARHAGPGARRHFDRARGEHTAPLEIMKAALAGMAGAVRTPEEMANSLAFLQLDLADPEFREHAAAHARAVGAEIADLLAQAADRGALAPGTDTAALARSVQITYNGALILWALTGEGDLAETLTADLDRLLAPYRPA